MCAVAVTVEDRAAALIPPFQASAPWDVTDAVPLPNYRLAVRFVDGVSCIVDLSARVASPRAGVFGALRDGMLSGQVFIAFGAVTWPGDIDLAPDAMHEAIKTKGEWRLD
jgi:hypothetical protein